MLGAILGGIGDGFLLFIIASGLTLIFGIMRILNFSHGGYFMIGAYIAYQILLSMNIQGSTLVLFLGVVVLGGILVGVIGLLTEQMLFQKIYGLPPIASLLGTFGLLLVIEGIAVIIWGVNPVSVSFPRGTGRAIQVASASVSVYALLLSLLGMIVAVGLAILLHKTPLGDRARALAEDRYMAELVGIDTRRLAIVVFVLGTTLAGMGGVLATPIVALTPDVATAFIIEAFAVVIVGGLGSVLGSLVAALGFGVLDSLAIVYYPPLSGITFYLVMFIVLIVRPHGLFGKPGAKTL